MGHIVWKWDCRRSSATGANLPLAGTSGGISHTILWLLTVTFFFFSIMFTLGDLPLRWILSSSVELSSPSRTCNFSEMEVRVDQISSLNSWWSLQSWQMCSAVCLCRSWEVMWQSLDFVVQLLEAKLTQRQFHFLGRRSCWKHNSCTLRSRKATYSYNTKTL